AGRDAGRDALVVLLRRVLRGALHRLLALLQPAGVHGDRNRPHGAYGGRRADGFVQRHPAHRRGARPAGDLLRDPHAPGVADVLLAARGAPAPVRPDRPRRPTELAPAAAGGSGDMLLPMRAALVLLILTIACKRDSASVVHRASGPMTIDGV